jgi:hypothetical protein
MRRSGEKTVEIQLRKNRYGISGGKLNFNWDAEHGRFIYMPGDDDALRYKREKEAQQRQRDEYNQTHNPILGVAESYETPKEFADVF